MTSLLTISLIICFLFGTAQEWSNYTFTQEVNCFAYHNDTLWVGTGGGVAKFLKDGTLLQNYNRSDGLAYDRVQSIAIDQNGNKWFGTGERFQGGGLSKFDGNTWTTYNHLNSPLPDYFIKRVLVDDQNNIWILPLTGGVVKFDGLNWTTFGIGNTHMAIDTTGTIWTLTGSFTNTKLVRIDDPNWTLFPLGGVPPADVGYFSSFMVDHQNVIWVPGFQGDPYTRDYLFRFDGVSWAIYDCNNSGYCPSWNDGLYSFADHQNNKWFANRIAHYMYDGNTWFDYTNEHNNRLLTIDTAGNKWFAKQYRPFRGITNVNDSVLFDPTYCGVQGNSIYGVGNDQLGRTWISNYGGGLTMYNQTDWTVFDSIYSPMYQVEQGVGGEIWLRSEWYLLSYDGNDFSIHKPQGTRQLFDMDIDQRGNILVGARYVGAFYYSNGAWVNFNTTNSGLVFDDVRAVAIDQHHHFWLCTYGGVSRFDGTNWYTYTKDNSGLPVNKIDVVEVDRNNVKWFGTHDGSLTSFDGKNWMTYDTTITPLNDDYVTAIQSDRTGNLWIGNWRDGGAIKFDGNDWIRYHTFNSGLGNNYVYSISVDNDNNIWFGTDLGAYKLTMNHSFSGWIEYDGAICDSSELILIVEQRNGTPPYTYSWSSNGDPLSCSTCENPEIVITQNSTITVSIIDSNNITTTDTLLLQACQTVPVGIQEARLDLKVYPNPTNKIAIIDLLGHSGSFDLNIISADGNILDKYSNLSGGKLHSIDLGHLNFGLYFVHLQSDEHSIVSKMIVGYSHY